MCTHNTLGHCIGCLAVRTPYMYIETNIQVCVRKYKFHQLTYPKEACFALQLEKLFPLQGERALGSDNTRLKMINIDL